MLRYGHFLIWLLVFQASGAEADVHLEHGEKITFGKQELEVRCTPGHTNGITKSFHKINMHLSKIVKHPTHIKIFIN